MPTWSLQSSGRLRTYAEYHRETWTTPSDVADRMEKSGCVLEQQVAQRSAELMASQKKVSFELGVEGSGRHRLTPGSLCLTSLIPSFLCKRGEIRLTSFSGL